MRKLLFTSLLVFFTFSIYSQNITDQVDFSIKEEVRLHPDVHLRYAHTSFSIDKYVIQDPYILIYSNTTGSFYLIDQENQLVVDQFDIFKKYPKIKTSNVSFFDNSGARIKLRSPFYNNGITMNISNIEPYIDSLYFTGLVKLKSKYYLLLVNILNNKINTTLKEYNIQDYFKKPTKSKVEFYDHYLYMDLLRSSMWNNKELFFYTFDPYVKKLPKDSLRAHELLFENSIYSFKGNELSTIFKQKNINSSYLNSSYVTNNNKLFILNNNYDSIFIYSDDLNKLKSKAIPRSYIDTLKFNNKESIIRNGYITKDLFTNIIYIIIPSLKYKSYSIYSIDEELNQFKLLKTFVSDLSLKKTKIYKGKTYFITTPNASEPSKLFYYDLYKNETLGDTIELTAKIQYSYSLFQGKLNRLWFKQMYGLENIKGDVYYLPKNHIKNKIESSALNKEDTEKQKSIEGLIELLIESYTNQENNKILTHLSCFDKFEIKILEKEVKKDDFIQKIDSVFYNSPIKDLFETISAPDFSYEGEMKTYHYEIKTKNGWHIFLVKIDNLWHLSSVAYKEDE
jgi:hypothetical protein